MIENSLTIHYIALPVLLELESNDYETVLAFSKCFLDGFYLISPSILKLTLYKLHQAEPHVMTKFNSLKLGL